MTQEPQIIELDPERTPRTMAIILLLCGLLGVGFMVVNSFMGDEPNLVESEWEEGSEPVSQRFDVMPNLVRGRQEVGESDEDEDSKRSKDVAEKTAAEKALAAKRKKAAATTPVGPFGGTATPGVAPAVGGGVGSGSK